MSTKNSKKGNAQTANVKTENAPVTDVATNQTNTDAINVDGLEKAADANLSKHVATDADANKFKDVEFLKEADPKDYHVDENISTKYDKEREDKVYLGLQLISSIKLASDKPVNPLLILLGKWWEVKPARSGIKSLLDAEAAAKGYPSDVYLQIELKKEIDELSELQTAIDRLRYSITYFKPRKPLSNKVPMSQISIDKIYYSVPTAALVEAKTTFGEDKDGLKAHILKIAIPANTTIEEL